jgi:hypothetical protein
MGELDRQLDVLVRRGLADVAGVSPQTFKASLEQLREPARRLPAVTGSDRVQPFVVVPDLGGARAESLVPLLRLSGSDRPGILDRNHGEQGLGPYQPLPELGVPAAGPYLVVDVDRGDKYRGARPREAVASIEEAGRTPLTITEGLFLQLVRPDVLQPNRCFMLAGSRRGDKRVPALWISQRAPKLGWCWEGNPHDWLGTASAGGRISPTAAPL